MTSCLGRRVAELADGRLRGPELEQALAHVAACASCAGALEAQRDVRRRLVNSSSPEPSSDFLARLGSLPQRGAPAPVVDLRQRRSHRRRAAVAGGSVVVGAVALFGGIAGLGQTAASVPAVVPDLRAYAVVHAGVGEVAPLGSSSMAGTRPRFESASFEDSSQPSPEGGSSAP